MGRDCSTKASHANSRLLSTSTHFLSRKHWRAWNSLRDCIHISGIPRLSLPLVPGRSAGCAARPGKTVTCKPSRRH